MFSSGFAHTKKENRLNSLLLRLYLPIFFLVHAKCTENCYRYVMVRLKYYYRIWYSTSSYWKCIFYFLSLFLYACMLTKNGSTIKFTSYIWRNVFAVWILNLIFLLNIFTSRKYLQHVSQLILYNSFFLFRKELQRCLNVIWYLILWTVVFAGTVALSRL